MHVGDGLFVNEDHMGRRLLNIRNPTKASVIRCRLYFPQLTRKESVHKVDDGVSVLTIRKEFLPLGPLLPPRHEIELGETTDPTALKLYPLTLPILTLLWTTFVSRKR